MKIAVPIPVLLGTLVCALLFSTASHSQNIDFGKSYVNITKGLNGGTVEPGDILEIRASIVVKSGTYDSCGYFDAVPAGTSYIPGTIRVLTNEGKIYKQFTDAPGDDQGWISGANVRINLGFNGASAPGTAFRRGRIVNTHRPSFFGNTCIMIASFRVTVTAAYNSTISIGGGSMSYKPSGLSLRSFVYPIRRIAVYKNYGMCPNAIGSNSIGTEFNGTFGSGKPRNRGISANVPVGYTYNTFTSNSPNDYYYGIPNNTSINTGYTTTSNWPKPDGTHRVFSLWDILGDHTGAANPVLGNPPADTVNNPNGGYMLVVNAAYRIDSAFQQTISNVCPNTYYEISIWMRNICSLCGCDSTGRGTGSAGYIPTAPGDSSGVHPNLSFNVNGVDYYSTGDILYSGEWIKKGFTFLTGPAQTSFTVKVFNNAPGGGGNDWALDDISVASCSPNLAFTPTNNPVVCVGNVVDFGAYIRSYFDNYVYYKWQSSTDGGLNWVDDSPVGIGSPVWNGTAYEYYTAYPTFVATQADSGHLYRVVVASTLSNITDPSCSFADAASILTLSVIDCGSPLATELISFSAAISEMQSNLSWTTSREEGPVTFTVEKSSDGRVFHSIASVNGYNNNASLNYYHWSEPYASNSTVYYRIKMSTTGRQKFSRIVKLTEMKGSVDFASVPNPFGNVLIAELSSVTPQKVAMQLIDNSGKVVRRQQFMLVAGNNTIEMGTQMLPRGLYTLQMQSGEKILNKKLLKL